MPRHTPSRSEQEAIALLTLAGYTVVRARTYEGMRERVRVAEVMERHAKEDVDHARRWGGEQCDVQRRLSDRLNAVCFAAAGLGVPIDAINAALAEADRKVR